ncbi:MAG: hypothetical protein ACR2RV_04820 [Verrucomicrobiales bacterium]
MIARVDFGQQLPDRTMGLSDGQIIAIATPTPDSTNGRAAVDPVASVMVDGDIVTFTITTEPGFLYAVDAGKDPFNWETLGSELAEGSTIEFTDSIELTRRLYRFRRPP